MAPGGREKGDNLGATSGADAGRSAPVTAPRLTVPLTEVERGAVRLVGGKEATNPSLPVEPLRPMPPGGTES